MDWTKLYPKRVIISTTNTKGIHLQDIFCNKYYIGINIIPNYEKGIKKINDRLNELYISNSTDIKN